MTTGELDGYSLILREAIGEWFEPSGPLGGWAEPLKGAATEAWQRVALPTLHYFRSIKIQDDTKMALGIGFAVGVAVVIGLMIFPGEPFDYSSNEFLKDQSKEEKGENKNDKAGLEADSGTGARSGPKKKKKKVANSEEPKDEGAKEDGSETKDPSPIRASGTEDQATASQPGVSADPFKDPKLQADARRAARFLGLSDDQLDKAVEAAKYEYETGVPPPSQGMSAIDVAHLVNHLIIFGLFCATIWAVNKDYGGAATRFFITHFPREATALGIPYPFDEE